MGIIYCMWPQMCESESYLQWYQLWTTWYAQTSPKGLYDPLMATI